jgi:ankyrin repeat protein
MNKNIYIKILFLLMLFQFQNSYAEDYEWDFVNALVKNDTQTIDKLLNDNINKMAINKKRLMYSFVLDYTRRENVLNMLHILSRYNIHANGFDLYNAINKSHFDDVIIFILNDGVNPNGEILLLATEKNRTNIVKILVGMGVDVNYNYPNEKAYADGMTALLYASKWANFELVKLLVENGANINIRSNNGSTALSIAYADNQIDIYNYLKEHGAIDIEANQNIPNQGISSLLNDEIILFKNGTYRLSENNNKIKFVGNNKSGNIIYQNNQGRTSNGNFLINGNILTLTINGFSFIYQINTDLSFSGNSEIWIRVGD